MISLILASYKRAELLEFGLYSISQYKYNFPLEIIVINDGLDDETKHICNKYNNRLDIKYYFSGQRNYPTVKSRCPAWAINIGVKKCNGDIIVLSCPEIWHLNDALNYIVDPLLNNSERIVTTPKSMFFDDNNYLVPILRTNKNIFQHEGRILDNLVVGGKGTSATRMPFLMGMYKKEFMAVGGYAEDMVGYAADDNDFVDRLEKNEVKHLKTEAKIIHLYHGGTNDGATHYDNPAWVLNYNIWKNRKEINPNQGKEWGIL